MNISEINTLKETLENEIAEEKKEPVEEGTLLDLLKDVEDESLLPLTNENGTIIGINGHTKVTGARCSKVINGQMTIGANEDERKMDQEALEKMVARYTTLFQKLGGPNVAFDLCLKIKAAGLKPTKALLTSEGVALVLPELQRVINEDGETIVSCDVAKSTAQCVIAELLEARLQANVGDIQEI